MKFNSPAEFFYKINQQFNWILAAPLGIFVLLYLEWRDDSWKSLIVNPFYHSLILYTFIPLILLIWFLGYKSFQDKIREIEATLPLPTKLEVFLATYLNTQMYYTISGVIAMTGLYLTGSNLFAGYYLILLFYVSLKRPSANYVNKVLKLEAEDREILIRKKPFDSGD